jgi:hypothetical protein
MKKNYFKMLFLIFVINLLSAPLLFAQGAYLNINSGYATSMSTQNLSGFENYTFDSYSMKSEQINFSFGKGLNFGADFGYMFNKNFMSPPHFNSISISIDPIKELFSFIKYYKDILS